MNTLAQIIYDDVEDIINKINFSELDKKTVLITGATGLVGTYFIACLKKASEINNTEIKVIAIAHNKTNQYYNDLLPKDTPLLTGDLTDIEFLKTLPEADYIIHTAGYGQPGKFLVNPIKTLKLNTLTTFFLLEKLKPNGKFLFISSSEVYSGSEKIPYMEEDIGHTNTDHKRSCYIEGKRCGESICNNYRDLGIEAKSARLSLAYGPGTKKGDYRVLNAFIEKALNGEISMLDTGEAKRTYCYITDAIEMMWNILFSGKDSIYNVGGESKTTIAKLANKIGTHLNVPIKSPPTSESIGGAPDNVWLNLNKTKKEFNKTDFVKLDKGLEKTIDWQLKLYNN